MSQSFFRRLDQLAGLQRHHCEANYKHQRHQSQKGCGEIADLQLPEHEGEKTWHQKQRQRLNLNRLVNGESSQNNVGHGQADRKHHNGFDHAFSPEELALSTATDREDFTAGCAEEADKSLDCQVEAAEQRVGFFTQELRPITKYPIGAMIAATDWPVCSIGNRRRR